MVGAKRKLPRLSTQILLLPLYVWILGFLVGPFLILTLYSIYTRLPDGSTSTELTLEAYKRLSDPLYLNIILRSLGLAVANTVFCLLLAFPAAYYMARLKGAWKAFALMLVLIPLTTSFLIRIFAVMDFLRLRIFGLDWIYTVPGILVALCYNYLPYAILPLYASFQRQDPRILEAAQDLGASKRKLLTKIIIPMHKSALFSAALFVLIPSTGEYLVPALVGGSRHFFIGNFLQNQFLTARNWPLGSALIVLLLLLTLFALRQLRKSEVLGGGLAK
ncbi:MAG: ABC transporter permease [Bdellovibrionota bacterium]